jgi:hypothetical protein
VKAILCVRDDFLGENFDDRIAAIRKPKAYARHLECDAHNALGLGVECEARNSVMGMTRSWPYRRERTSLSAIDAWRRAAVDDVS